MNCELSHLIQKKTDIGPHCGNVRALNLIVEYIVQRAVQGDCSSDLIDFQGESCGQGIPLGGQIVQNV